MIGLFNPAVRVMNRLRYPQKFLLVGVLLLIPTIVLMTQYVGSVTYDAQFAENEQMGLQYNAVLFDVLRAVQDHALYSQLVLLGRGEEYSDELERARLEVAERFDAAGVVDAALGMELEVSPVFAQLKAAWLRLLEAAPTLSPQENLEEHLTFQDQLLDLVTIVGNNSNLILDPDIDSYYLMDTVITKLPQTMVYLSQLQVAGVNAIQAGLTEDRRLRMLLLSETTSDNIARNRRGFEFSYERNPALAERLRPVVDEVFGKAQEFLSLTGRFQSRTGSVYQFHTYASDLLDQQYVLYDVAAQELDQLLEIRINGFDSQRNAVLAVAALAILASVYFFIGFYLAVRRTIDDLRHTSDSMISGKLQQSMTLENHDEFEEVVTAFNNIANEMVSARDRALQASRLKDEFLATMSHELRTPLNSIIGYTGILTSGMRGQIDETARGLLGRVRESSQHLLSLINDILDIAKIEAGRMDIVATLFDLREFIASVQGQTEVLAKQKQLNFEVVMDPSLPENIYADSDKLAQVLRNLLSNAVKFTEEGVVRLQVYPKGEVLHFEVSDTGIGIPPQALDYIFDEFRQVDGSTRRVYGGTGLGLSIVRKFCLAMGGRIQVQSRLGAGSTFTAVIPLHAEKAQQEIAVRGAV